MIPIETIKRLSIQCGFEGFAGTCMCTIDQLQSFANAIEAMTIDRCLAMSHDKVDTTKTLKYEYQEYEMTLGKGRTK